MDALASIAVGVGLAAACGFRVFVPLLVACLASRAGHLPLASGFVWLASTPALVTLSVATILEIAAYYVPWLDHALDVLAGPAAVVAGIVASASVLVELPPFIKWGTAVVAGGGAAGVVKGASALARLKSTALTGGLANPVVATAELVSSTVTSVIAIVLPLVTVFVLVAGCVALFVLSGRLARSTTESRLTRG